MIEWSALIASTLHRGIQSAVPLSLAANGELISERAGVVNIGIEGTMLIGAMSAAAVGWSTGSAMLACMAGMASGAVTGLLFAFWTVWHARDQIVTGLAINLLALGLTGVAFERMNHHITAATGNNTAFVVPQWKPLVSLPDAAPAWLTACIEHDPLVLFSLLITLLLAFVLRQTRTGLALIATGENPQAAETSGVRVHLLRMVAVVTGSALAGLAGAHLVTGISNRFQEAMTGGRGFVALALVIFGRWSPWRVALVSLLFGLLDALQVTLQPALGQSVHVLYPLLLALPYVLTLAALATRIRAASPPAWLARPYQRRH